MTIVNIDFGQPLDPPASNQVNLNFGPIIGPPPEPATATVILALPAVTMSVVADYASNVSRLTVSDLALPWEHADQLPEGSSQLWAQAANKTEEHRLPWEVAKKLDAGTASPMGQLTPIRTHTYLAWQQAIQLGSLTSQTFTQLLPRPEARLLPWQVATQMASGVALSFVQLEPRPEAFVVPWGSSDGLSKYLSSRFGAGAKLAKQNKIPWEIGRQPPNGREPPTIPPVIPPYVPSFNLNFKCRLNPPNPLAVLLNFGLDPCPDESNQVPARKVYFIVNTVSLKRVSDNIAVGLTSVSVGIDYASWCWSFNANIPYNQLEKVEPTATGPVEVELEINGLVWRFLVEQYGERKQFARTDIPISGRSVTAYLENPYAPIRSYKQESAIQSRAFAEAELTRPGLETGFTLDWQLIDSLGWLMPAGTWSYTSLTPIQVIQALAQGAGGYVNSHPSDRELIVLPEYSLPHWEWAGATPDKVVPKTLIKSQNLQWTEKPLYNGVYVVGERTGVNAFVKRFGTNGAFQAQMFVSPMISHVDAARNKGMSILSAGGKQAQVGLDLPMEPSLGLVTPGMMIEVTNGGYGTEPAWRGMVRSTSISATWNQSLTITQSIGLERHYGGL